VRVWRARRIGRDVRKRDIVEDWGTIGRYIRTALETRLYFSEFEILRSSYDVMSGGLESGCWTVVSRGSFVRQGATGGIFILIVNTAVNISTT
jgi:hypothetical protein